MGMPAIDSTPQSTGQSYGFLVFALSGIRGHWKDEMDCIEDEGPRLAVEFMAKLVSRPIKATYDLATLSAKNQQGGEVVTASTDIEMDGHRVAAWATSCVTPTASKAGSFLTLAPHYSAKTRAVTIVSSAIDGRDIIISSLQSSAQIREYANHDGIPGLLLPGYTEPTEDRT